MKIGPYEVLGTLGRGGAGAVLRALAPSGQEVAVKVIHALDGDRVARFEREERLLAKFTMADGFVPLLASGRTREGPYLVMPIIEGGTLRDRLEDRRLGVAETLALARSLARALARAHEKGIVHRDLKPENILFHEGRPLVADLGLGKHFDKDAPGASLSVSVSKPGQMRGTFGYMPHEQMTDAKAVGPASDVFALGAILYECLAGKPAFPGETFVQVLDSVGRGAALPLARACPAAPVWLVRVVERAIAKAPDERFADGGELLAALAGPSSKKGAAALVLVALLIAAALVLVTRRAPAPSPAVVAAAPPPPPPAPAPPHPGAAAETAEVRALRVDASRGDRRAIFDLGECLAEGRGVARDDAEAVRWFRLAATKDDLAAMVKLGAMLRDGRGTDRNEAEAVEWFKKAADEGDGWGAILYAEMLAEGRGVPKDMDEAMRRLRAMADAGNTAVMVRLGELSRKKGDDDEAIGWYRKGAFAGDSWAMERYGECLMEGRGCARNPEEAARWYRRSGEKANGTALVRLGMLFQEGTGVRKDEAEAVRLFRVAADSGNGWAMQRLGDAYRDGRGVEKDVEQAVAWYRKAVANDGNAEARAALRALGKE